MKLFSSFRAVYNNPLFKLATFQSFIIVFIKFYLAFPFFFNNFNYIFLECIKTYKLNKTKKPKH